MLWYAGTMKNSKQLERHFKGAANHSRIDILFLISGNPDITVEGIAEGTHKNFKTVSEHTKRLVHAGLVNKSYRGRNVLHALSPYGIKFVHFIKTFI
ncbi:MAG: winged helix-turn-helix domain-containing protein [bacterium]|nr:winged helix-turn-helix domain-containing protein [bacterium]